MSTVRAGLLTVVVSLFMHNKDDEWHSGSAAFGATLSGRARVCRTNAGEGRCASLTPGERVCTFSQAAVEVLHLFAPVWSCSEKVQKRAQGKVQGQKVQKKPFATHCYEWLYKWAAPGSNWRPLPCEDSALTN